MRTWLGWLLLLLALLLLAGVGFGASRATGFIKAVGVAFFASSTWKPPGPLGSWTPSDLLPEPSAVGGIGWDPEAAAYCVDLVGRAQSAAERGTEPAMPPGLALKATLPGLWTGDPSMGFVATGAEGDCYVALRGTEPTKLWEWVLDLRYTLVPVPFAEGARGHSGFLDAYSAVREAVAGAVRASLAPGRGLWITGHSLGGAVAVLAAADLVGMAAATGSPIRAYTIAAPKAGDGGLRDWFAARSGPGLSLWALENMDDVIPSLPLAANPNAADPQTPYVYDQPSRRRALFVDNRGCLATNHGLDVYARGTTSCAILDAATATAGPNAKPGGGGDEVEEGRMGAACDPGPTSGAEGGKAGAEAAEGGRELELELEEEEEEDEEATAARSPKGTGNRIRA